MNPSIRKAALLRGQTLLLRDAVCDDAPFIVGLRTDERKARHLSATSSDIDVQRSWLANYALADDQAYFVIEHENKSIGTVRLYDAQGDSFCWGSWILVDGAPMHAALESALIVYAYALDHLRFRTSHFDVRRRNERVWQFHERFGAKRIGETELDYLYSLQGSAINASRARYRRFLPNGVEVQTIR
jgi:RimJ/RimL family protein N-acetyltransferase